MLQQSLFFPDSESIKAIDFLSVAKKIEKKHLKKGLENKCVVRTELTDSESVKALLAAIDFFNCKIFQPKKIQKIWRETNYTHTNGTYRF